MSSSISSPFSSYNAKAHGTSDSPADKNTCELKVISKSPVASTLMSEIKKGLMSTLRSKIGALLIKPALKKTLVKFDATEYGGAPVLGLKGLVVKTHGNATRKEISNAILQCVTFQEQRITEIIEDMMRPAEEVKSDE